MRLRRRVPRQEAHLQALCVLEDELTTVGWRECGILDLSTAGVGITFHHARPTELIGRSIFVEVPSATELARFRTEGEIKNARSIQSGLARVGIEFHKESRPEEALRALLAALNEVNDVGSTMLLVRMTRPT